MKRPAIRWTAMLAAAVFVVPASARAQAPPPATPREMVAAYEALADTILGANKAEVKHAVETLFSCQVDTVNTRITKDGKRAVVKFGGETSAEDIGMRIGVF